MEMYRQGDVLLIKVDNIPKEKCEEVEREQGKLILARGEATGHHHAIANKHAKLLAAQMGMFLILKKAAELYHQEHDPIDLPPGNYQVILQREYTAKDPRRVLD